MYAENPSKGFMPSPGSIASWRVPPGSVAFTHHGEVRVDSGVQQGDQVCRTISVVETCCMEHPAGAYVTSLVSRCPLSSILALLTTLTACQAAR